MFEILNEVFYSMEKEAIEMLIKRDIDNASILIKQFEKVVKVERRFTQAGFFTEYQISDDAPKIFQKQRGPLRSVYGKISGLEIGVGFLLFLSNGLIDTLECYEYDSIDFLKEITDYMLSYDTPK